MSWGLITHMVSTFLDRMTERLLVGNQIIGRMDNKVVGGVYITIQSAPYQLSVQYMGRHICGGSIISANWALTAAHCVSDESIEDFRVHSGSTFRYVTGTNHPVSKILIHEEYDDITEMFDIALLEVKNPFKTKSKYEQIVRLPKAGFTPVENSKVIASGWGSILDGFNLPPLALKQAELRIRNWAKCKEIYAKLDVNVTEHMLCAGHKKGGRDTCQGDSGGPLVFKKLLVGIVSTGYGCGVRGHPGIYTNVGYFHDWIKKHSDI